MGPFRVVSGTRDEKVVLTDAIRRAGGLVLIAALLPACQALGTAGTSTTTTSSTTTTTRTSTTTSTTTTTLPPVVAEGRVVDSGGRPIAGVEVEFGGAIASTDAEGHFVVAASQPGTLRLSKRGWEAVETPWRASPGSFDLVLEPITVRGIRVGPGAAGDDAFFSRLLDLAEATAVNTLVFDTKQEGGKVLYDTVVPEAHEIGAVEPWYDPVDRIARAREAGLYTITRIVVFEDALWVTANRGERLAGSWVDPTAVGATQYNIDLAVEACALGFDEVQFDYVRYPAGRTATVSGHLRIPVDERVANITSFVAEARAALASMGCSLSADILGIIVSVGNDQGVGQRPEELSAHLDAISPMVYPSHYSSGWLGFSDPNDHPYAVTADAIDAALPRIAAGTVLRPWLQAFWWTESQIRASIQAAEDRDVGWMLWNVGSVFSGAAIPTDEEVGG